MGIYSTSKEKKVGPGARLKKKNATTTIKRAIQRFKRGATFSPDVVPTWSKT